jgi:endogenous inhibitor of DNA gyrase (YacG/DUF329 family)
MRNIFLIKTNMHLRLIITLGMMAIGVLMCIIGSINSYSTKTGLILLCGMLISCIGFVLSILVVRCPRCKTKLYWKAIKEHEISNWLTWLLTLDKCPICGFDGFKKKDPKEDSNGVNH